MPAERLSMRTIRKVLRLKWQEQLSNLQIAASCRIARSTVREYLGIMGSRLVFQQFLSLILKTFESAKLRLLGSHEP
jgi:response regulator of citrate/malate metabolism